MELGPNDVTATVCHALALAPDGLVSKSELRDCAGVCSEVRHALTILAVETVAQSVAFYSSAFGWVPSVETPVYVEFELAGGQRVGLYQRDGFGKNIGQVPARIPRGAIAPTELYFYADDLQVAIDRMKAAGARELSARSVRAWGDEAAYFSDPSGNVLVLAKPAHTLAG